MGLARIAIFEINAFLEDFAEEQISEVNIISDGTCSRGLLGNYGSEAKNDLDLIAEEVSMSLVLNKELAEKVSQKGNFEAKLEGLNDLVRMLKGKHTEINGAAILSDLAIHDFSPLTGAQPTRLCYISNYLPYSERNRELSKKLESINSTEFNGDILDLAEEAIDHMHDDGKYTGYYDGTGADTLLELQQVLKEKARLLNKYNLLHRVFDREFLGTGGKSKFTNEIVKKELANIFGEEHITEIRRFRDDELDYDKNHIIAIIDRHVAQRPGIVDGLGEYNIILPLASATLELIKKGEIQVDKQRMDDNIKQVINKYYNSAPKKDQ